MKIQLKKISRKILTFLKRFSAVLAAVGVFFAASSVPSLAADSDSIFNQNDLMTPLFDYDYISVTYDSGNEVVFNLKDVFFGRAFVDRTQVFTVTGSDGSTILSFTLSDMELLQLPFMINGTAIYLPYWRLRFQFPVNFMSSISIHCRESIYDYGMLSSAYDNGCDNITFYTGLNYTDCDFRYYNDTDFYYPYYVYNNNGAVVGRSLNSIDISHEEIFNSSSLGDSGFDISPRASVKSLYNYLPTAVTSSDLIYFSDFTTSITLQSGSELPEYAIMDIYYVPVNNTVTFHDYYNNYFPGYRYDLDSIDFTSWLVNSISGFFNFQFMPGITIGGLFAFVVSIGIFVAFLRYFAGG